MFISAQWAQSCYSRGGNRVSWGIFDDRNTGALMARSPDQMFHFQLMYRQKAF